jgi:hypothetical protein
MVRRKRTFAQREGEIYDKRWMMYKK